MKYITIFSIFAFYSFTTFSSNQYSDKQDIQSITNLIESINTSSTKNIKPKNVKFDCRDQNSSTVPFQDEISKVKQCSNYFYENVLNNFFLDSIAEEITKNDLKQIYNLKKRKFKNKQLNKIIENIWTCDKSFHSLSFIFKWKLIFSSSISNKTSSIFENELKDINSRLVNLDLDKKKILNFLEEPLTENEF